MKFQGFWLVIISIRFLNFCIKLAQDLSVEFFGRHCFNVDFKMAGGALKTFMHCFVEREVFLFTATDLRFSISSFEILKLLLLLFVGLLLLFWF